MSLTAHRSRSNSSQLVVGPWETADSDRPVVIAASRSTIPIDIGSPVCDSNLNADVAQLVERHLAKVKVAGSNPVVRSKPL